MFGKFVILFSRPDGTIVVSEDLNSVYLLVGLYSNFTKMFGGAPSTFGSSSQNKNAYSFHDRTAAGIAFYATLLPFQGIVVYDGLAAGILHINIII